MNHELNRRLPAEWEPQATVLLTWPNPDTDWADTLVAVEQCYGTIAAAITQYQPLTILCADAAIKKRARAVITSHQASLPSIEHPIHFIENVPHNDTWIRDYGPITLSLEYKRSDISPQPLLLDFTFNGWGNKFAAELDNGVTKYLAEQNQWLHCFNGIKLLADIESNALILEGGSIESDGAGTILTTKHCLTAPNRNQPLGYDEISDQLLELLGAQQLLSLTSGQLSGDDTDGHIDTLARLCSTDTIVYQGCSREDDEHFIGLNLMAEELTQLRNLKGDLYRCLALPLPDPKRDAEGQRLPASYANFLIINGAVLVPTYQDRHDQQALDVIQACFPDRQVIGIDCLALIEQGGSLHCCTMQIPQL